MNINAYDIETFVNNESREHVPYCVCYAIKDIFYYNYYDNKENVVISSIKSIISKVSKKEKNIFYVHKLNFDGILIISALSIQHEIKFSVFTREMDIYSIKINYLEKQIEFRCSKKILPSSLREISISFNIEKKLPFPYLFSSLSNLNYVGEIPDVKYFNSFED
jgi:hypothetical protein